MHTRLVTMAGLVLLTALGLLWAAPARSQPAPARPFAWLEGEAPATTTFNRHGWYCCDGVRPDLLSPGTPGGQAGDWLAHYANDGRAVTADYAFDLPADATYTLWLRASSYTVRLRYRLDEGPWTDIDSESDRREYMNLLESGRIDLRFLAWLRLGQAQLATGTHRLTFELAGHPARQNGQEVHGGIDAIAVVGYPWAPAGGLQPSAQPTPTPGPGDWFPLIADDDPLSPESITDMSGLLHRPAGLHGALEADGAAFRFADGTPVRFWGLNAQPAATEDLMRQQAAYYAKHGVNLVRLHPVESLVGLLERDPDSVVRRLDPARLDRLDQWFAILKEVGIYSDWSVFYPHVITAADGYPAELYAELPDASGGKSTSGFVNFMRPLQDAEWLYLRTLLGHVNPYTGLAYVDDPALAILEVHNEDSVFWHYPLNPLEAGQDGDRSLDRHQAALQGLWRDWLRRRYASDAELLAAWGPTGQGSRAGDCLDNSRLPIYGAWEMAADGPARNKAEKRRMGDFVRFLAETQREYFTRRGEELRALGYQGVRVTTAWQAGGPAAHLANLWTDTALDAIDRHAYFGGGEGNWRITTGEVYNGSHLSEPGSGILNRAFEQVDDKPFIMSEWSQSPPNQWKAEIAPLMAFFGMGLHGWDASMHFSGSLPRLGSGWPGLGSFVTETPHYIGQFPALAFAVQHGHLLQGGTVAARRIATDDVFGGVDARTQDTPSGGWGAGSTGGDLAVPLAAFAMGRLTVEVGDGLPRSERVDWDRYHDSAAATVRSTTDELAWDYRQRVVEVRGTKTQGLMGWAGGRRHELPALTVDVRTPFISLLLTPLDDRPLAQSEHILITALARDQQTGARYNADGSRLEDLGGPPLLLEPVQATLTFHTTTAGIASARPLDLHGVPREQELERPDQNTVVIDGRYATYYYEVRMIEGEAGTVTPTTTPGPDATPSITATPSPRPGERPAYLPWAARER